jgi:hypothetical protein
VAPMPAPLSCTPCSTGLSTAGRGWWYDRAPAIEADGQTMSPSGQTILRTEAGSQIVSPGDQTAPIQRLAVRPPPWVVRSPGHASLLLSPASLTSAAPRAAPTTSVAPHMAPSTPPVPRAAPASMTMVAPPTASERYTLHYSRHPRATREPPTQPLHQQSPPTKAVPVAPPVNPHPMTTRAKRGFWPTDSPCRPPQHQLCRWYPPSSVSP